MSASYLAGHSALSVPSGTAGRAQYADVFDRIAECFTAPRAQRSLHVGLLESVGDAAASP
jgi:hypothetical protein